MKLSSQDTQNLQKILSTCAVGGIDSIIIEDGKVRGMNESNTCIIISTLDIPKLPQKMGLSKISTLKQRLDLFSGNSQTVIDAKESDRGEVSSLEISAGKNKVQFRCTSARLIKAPTAVNDEMVYRISATKDEMKMILSAIKVMGGKNVELTIKKDLTVSFKLSDTNNDPFTSILESPAEKISDEQMDSIVHYYDADIFSAVMRSSADSVSFEVGEVGTIRTHVNGHAMILMPRINEDDLED